MNVRGPFKMLNTRKIIISVYEDQEKPIVSFITGEGLVCYTKTYDSVTSTMPDIKNWIEQATLPEIKLEVG